MQTPIKEHLQSFGTNLRHDPSRLQPAERLGSYRLQGPMGSGGTGTVFAAIDERDGTAAAVKVAHDTKGWQREILRKEIALLGRLGKNGGHPGVVRLRGHGTEGGRLWYAMDLVRGVNLGVLADALASEPRLAALRTTAFDEESASPRVVPAPDSARAEVWAALGLLAEIEPPQHAAAERRFHIVLKLIARIAQALAYVHAQAIVHADLAPGNIVIRGDGVPVLLDFGTSLYTFVDGVAREAPQATAQRHGTPGYMSPEQIRGEPFDARTDLYALGCLFYELLVGQPPFAGDAPTVQRLHLETEVRPPSTIAPSIPTFIDDLVLALLHKDPTRRVAFAEDVVAALAPWLAAPEGGVPPPVTTGLRLYRSRLHGRARSVASLRARLASTLGGQGGFVLVSGASGLGKTRMLNELATLGARQGFEVVVGQCQGSGEMGRSQDAPLEPLLPAVRRLADQFALSGAAVPLDLRDAFAALRPLEPALADLVGSADALLALPPQLARDRLLRSVLRCLMSLAAGRPTLLLIDDLQWADELTRGFMTSPRLKELKKTPLLIVATYRDDEVDPAFAAACTAICDERVEIGPLDRADVAALVHDMAAAATLPEGVVDDIFRASEGNPFFAAECLRVGLDEGIYRRDAEGRWHTSAPVTAHAAYEAGRRSLARFILPRLGRLGAAARRVGEIAALLGREFEADELFSLLPAADDEAARSALDELFAHRMLEEPVPGRLRFVHDKLREACEEALSADDRRSAHRTVALALSALHAEKTTPALAARLGRHWAGAGEPEQAAVHLESAARAFANLNATAEASELYAGALRELGGVAGAPGVAAKRAEIAEALGDLLALTAKHGEARERYAQAAEGTGDPLDRARLLRKAARSFWTVHRYDEATAALAEARALLEPASAARDATAFARERIEISQNQFWVAYFGRRFSPAVDALLAEMERATAAHGTVRQRGIYEKCAGMYKLVRARFRPSEAVIAHARRSLELLQGEPAEGADALEAQFSLGFSLVACTTADCEEGLAVLEACAASASRVGDITNIARALAYATVALRRLGKIDETVAMAERTRRAAEEAQLLPYFGVASACLAWAAWRRSQRHDDDDSRAAHRLVEEARAWWTRAGHPFPYRWLAEMVAVALAAGADAPAAAAEPLTVLGRADQFHLPDELDSAIAEARAACLGGDAAAGQRQLTRVLRLAAQLGF